MSTTADLLWQGQLRVYTLRPQHVVCLADAKLSRSPSAPGVHWGLGSLDGLARPECIRRLLSSGASCPERSLQDALVHSVVTISVFQQYVEPAPHDLSAQIVALPP